MSVARSELITCLDEARDYYRSNLSGVRRVTCCGHRIEIVFPFEATHLYSVELKGDLPDGAALVTQPISNGKFEARMFRLERARLMDFVLPAISKFTVSIPGYGQHGREKRVLHGPKLPSGEYMRVILRPGPGIAWTCVSAFPVNHSAWMDAYRAKRAKFPP